MNVHDNPITLESDDGGTTLIVDLAGMDVDFPLGSVRCTLSTAAALELYEHVDRALGEWAREGISARRAVAAGVTLDEYVGRTVNDEIDDMLAAGDHLRKARRENG